MEKLIPEHYLVIKSSPEPHGARHQAQRWLEEKIAASVNVLPHMDSVYHWKGDNDMVRSIRFSSKRVLTNWMRGSGKSAPTIPVP